MREGLVSFFHWWAMGGYASYVWSAYGSVFGIFILTFVIHRKQRYRLYQQLKKNL